MLTAELPGSRGADTCAGAAVLHASCILVLHAIQAAPSTKHASIPSKLACCRTLSKGMRPGTRSVMSCAASSLQQKQHCQLGSESWSQHSACCKSPGLRRTSSRYGMLCYMLQLHAADDMCHHLLLWGSAFNAAAAGLPSWQEQP